MSALVIRPATLEDALCISVLGSQVFLDTYAKQGISPLLAREVVGTVGLEAITNELNDPSIKLVVAERGEFILGFAKWAPGERHELMPADQPTAGLHRLYVQEASTGTGIGKALIQAVEADAASTGARSMWLTAYVGNERALRFYPRRGYVDSGSTMYTSEGVSHENRLFVKQL